LNRQAFPPALNPDQQYQLKRAVQKLPGEVGIDFSNWNWKVVRHFLKGHFDLGLCRSSCLNYLHRLGFVGKRPRKRFLKANGYRREAFVAEYVMLLEQAQRDGAKIFFVDEAHFRADGDLRRKWVLKGQPALVDSSSPRWGEKASYYSGVCLETGEVEAMEVTGNSTAETTTAFLQQTSLLDCHPVNLTINDSITLKRVPLFGEGFEPAHGYGKSGGNGYPFFGWAAYRVGVTHLTMESSGVPPTSNAQDIPAASRYCMRTPRTLRNATESEGEVVAICNKFEGRVVAFCNNGLVALCNSCRKMQQIGFWHHATNLKVELSQYATMGL
jgi:hypothetical protein